MMGANYDNAVPDKIKLVFSPCDLEKEKCLFDHYEREFKQIRQNNQKQQFGNQCFMLKTNSSKEIDK